MSEDLVPPLPNVLIEPNFRGHRMSFCSLLAREAGSRGVQTVLASSTDTWSSAEYELRFPTSAAVEKFDLGPLPAFGGIRYQLWVYRKFRAASSRYPGSRIIILEGDKFAPVLAVCLLPKRSPVTLLTIRPPVGSGHSVRSWSIFIPKFLGCLILEARGVTVIGLCPATEKRSSYRIGRWRGAPDPVDIEISKTSSATYQERFDLDRSKFRYGVFGNVTRRKNLDMVLDALAISDASDVGLLVSGLVSAGELEICGSAMQRFTKAGGTLVLDNRLLSDSDLNAAIASVDVTVMAHSANGPSEILGKSLALGTFVVASGSEVLRAELARFGSGAWSRLNVVDLNLALLAARETCRERLAPTLADGSDFSREMLWTN